MLPNVGSLVFTNGREAGIVLGHEQDREGALTGGLYVGKFASVERIEPGNFGLAPSAAPEHAPSYLPESAQAATPTAGASEPLTPMVGGQEPNENQDVPVETEQSESERIRELETELAKLRTEQVTKTYEPGQIIDTGA